MTSDLADLIVLALPFLLLGGAFGFCVGSWRTRRRWKADRDQWHADARRVAAFNDRVMRELHERAATAGSQRSPLGDAVRRARGGDPPTGFRGFA